ncbi:MAG: signal recognition particle protein [Holosporaceae bacterium]|jgi:signal recognition particle subunit SRP54|nr:signal recognition particle protein [Holosporaceae bacterium]
MFDSFSNRIIGIFEKLRKSGVLKESDVDEALREIRVALLEADVSLEVAKKFIAEVKEKAVGQNVIKSVSPGQMVTKIVHEHLVELLGNSATLKFEKKPYKIMVVGLQGAGKTTSVVKLAALFLKKNKKVAIASTDIYRPAAIEQLRVLSSRVRGVVFAQDLISNDVDSICKNALNTVKNEEVDALILDTAGRLHIDEMKMQELLRIQDIVKPDEVLLVIDIMTGQDALNIARKFSQNLKISGAILTRVDGDARGGVALSMRAVTGCEIKFLCTGEQLDDIEFFQAERIADRLLGMGDIISLVEKAKEVFSEEEAEKTTQNLQRGVFTFDDLASQLEKMSKFGGLSAILKMLPQSRELDVLLETHGMSEKTLDRNLAIIRSMTKQEKRNHKLLNGSRKKRIAAGSGVAVQEVNKLIKQYEGALDIFRKMGKNVDAGTLFGRKKMRGR